MVIVVLELVFAFSVGIICVIFSFNLFRALSDLDQNLPIGDLPSRYGGKRSFVSSPRSAAGVSPPDSKPSVIMRRESSRENLKASGVGENRNSNSNNNSNNNSNSNSNTNNSNMNSNYYSNSNSNINQNENPEFEGEFDIELNHAADDPYSASYSSQSGQSGSSVLHAFTDYVKFW
jgi:hypothetical protein